MLPRESELASSSWLFFAIAVRGLLDSRPGSPDFSSTSRFSKQGAGTLESCHVRDKYLGHAMPGSFRKNQGPLLQMAGLMAVSRHPKERPAICGTPHINTGRKAQHFGCKEWAASTCGTLVFMKIHHSNLPEHRTRKVNLADPSKGLDTLPARTLS